MRITKITDRLNDQRILSIIAHSQFMPTQEKLNKLADTYQADPAITAFGYEDHGLMVGVMITKKLGTGEFEIVSIATDPDYRCKGVASALISHAITKQNCTVLIAETDDDAVDFYRKCGFQVQSLGAKHPNVIRYQCILTAR